MFNPFVSDEEIRAFLLCYCESVSAGTKLMNVRGTLMAIRNSGWYIRKIQRRLVACDTLLRPSLLEVIGATYGTQGSHCSADNVFFLATQKTSVKVNKHAITVLRLVMELVSVRCVKGARCAPGKTISKGVRGFEGG